MTDGILLTRSTATAMLRRYDTIIIDEAHERSLNVDFLLGYLKQLLPQRPDLKVIITCATIDPESFAQHFADGARPIIEVSGRTYPVEIRYRPLVAEATEDDDDDRRREAATDRLPRRHHRRARELDREPARRCARVPPRRDRDPRCRGRRPRPRTCPGTEVLPLYGRLSAAEQHRVFEPSAAPGIRRRVVLATNVAETSLTVPGIRYVIDAGTARISPLQRAGEDPAAADRGDLAGVGATSARAARAAPATASRSGCTPRRTSTRAPEFTEPEILRTNLAAVILQMLSLGLGDIAAFPFLHAAGLARHQGRRSTCSPSSARSDRRRREPAHHARSAASSRSCRSTRGFARMLIEAKRHGVAPRGPGDRRGPDDPGSARAPAREARRRPTGARPFADPTSDFLTLLTSGTTSRSKQTELSRQRVPAAVQGRVPQLPARARVAGPLPAARSGWPSRSG